MAVKSKCMEQVAIIPQSLAKAGELVVIPRREYERLTKLGGQRVRETDVARWSREAKQLKKTGKLPLLASLRDLR